MELLRLSVSAFLGAMKKSFATAVLLTASAVACAAPPPNLSYSVSAWAAPRTVERYQFHLSDLNGDGVQDAVVYVTDPSYCGGAGCPLLTFKGVPGSFDFIASSGSVNKPIYALEEMRNGWRTLAGVVGFGAVAGIVPIRWKMAQQGYRSTPINEPVIELTAAMTRQVLRFEETVIGKED